LKFMAARAGQLLADQRVRYAITGGLAAILYAALFAAGWAALSGPHPGAYPLVAMVAHMASAVAVYPLQRRWVFGVPWSAGGLVIGFLRFYAVYAAGLVASLVGLPVLVELVGAPVLAAQGLIMVVVPVISYLVHRSWTFRSGPAAPASPAVPGVPAATAGAAR
jgi:putative flippase GtrA